MSAHVFAGFLVGMAEMFSLAILVIECEDGNAVMAVVYTIVALAGIWAMIALCRYAARQARAQGEGETANG